MGLINPSSLSQTEFQVSPLISQVLVNKSYLTTIVLEQQTAIKEVMKTKLNKHSAAATQLRATLPSNLQLATFLCQEKGASSWLTVLPIQEYRFTLLKTAFRDAIALRYGLLPANIPTSCACGATSLLSMLPTSASADIQDGAQCDVATNGGSHLDRAFFDVKIFNTYPSNRCNFLCSHEASTKASL